MSHFNTTYNFNIDQTTISKILNEKDKWHYAEDVSKSAFKHCRIKAWILSRKGHAYSTLKNYDRALNDFKKVTEIEPNNACIFRARGTIYRRLEQYANASNDFNKLLEIEPNDAWALRERGEI